MTRRRALSVVFVAAAWLWPAELAEAQAVAAEDREAIVRQELARGGTAAEIEAVMRHVDDAAAAGLPTAPLVNKVREGIAKNAPTARIEQVVTAMSRDLGSADRLLQGALTGDAAERRGAVVMLAEAIGAGVSADAVLEIGRQTGLAGAPPSASHLAGAARGLSYISSAALSVGEGTNVVVEAIRRGYRPQDLVDLGREVKRRERDYQAGRATLRALRDRIARGERPEQLFRDLPAPAVERPSPSRPETPATPERPARPVPTERPERPERPVMPARPATR